MALEKVGLQAVIEGMGPFQSAAKQIDQTYDKLSASSTKASGVLSRLGGVASTAIGFAVGTVAVQAIGKFTSEIGGMITAGMAIEQTEATFAKLVGTVGGTLPTAMDKLRKATRGMVSDQDLMLAGNKFLAMGLAETEDEAAKLSEIATQLGSAMGEDATASMENFALMLANQSIPRLDSFGISAGQVRVRILELMDADKSLTREQAFMTATMEQAAVTMEKVGEQSGSTAAVMAQFRAQVQNLKTGIGRALIPIMSALLKIIIPIVQVVGDKLLPVFQRFGQWIGDAITIFREFIDALMIGGEMGDFLEDVIGKRMTAIILPFIDLFQRVRKAWPKVVNILKKFAGIIVKIETTRLKILVKLFQWFGKRLTPIVQRFTKVLRELVSNVDERLRPFREAIEGIGEAFEWLRAGDIEAFLERLWFAVDEAFGSRVADAVYQFADMITGVFHAFEFLRAGDFPAFLDRLRSALANVVGPDMAAVISRTVERIIDFGRRAAEGLGKLKDAAVGLWQKHLYPRFAAIRKGISTWWDEMGGAKGILGRIGTGWQRYIAAPLMGFYKAHLAGPLSIIGEKIGNWWTRMGGVTGILGRIGAGWRKYIADPLIGFYTKYLQTYLASIRMGISAWWTGLSEGGGIMVKIAAGWNKYIAMPLVGFWEAHLEKPFGVLTTQIGIWAQTIWDFIKKRILEPLGLIGPAAKDTAGEVEGVAAAIAGIEVKEHPRGGPLGYLDRFKDAWKKAYAGGPGFLSFVKSLGKFFVELGKAVWAAIRALLILAIMAIPRLLIAIKDSIIDFLDLNAKIRDFIGGLLGVDTTVTETESMWDKLSRWVNWLADQLTIAATGVNEFLNTWLGMVKVLETPIKVPPIPFPKIPGREYPAPKPGWYPGQQAQAVDVSAGLGAPWASQVSVPATGGPVTYDYRRYESRTSPVTLHAYYTQVQDEASIAEDFETLSILNRIG